MKNLYLKIVNYLKTKWFLIISNPIYVFREKNRKKQEIKELHKNFKLKFGVSPDDVKNKIKTIETIYPYLKQTNLEYHNNDLINNRIELNHINNVTPCFYEPDIIEIHNENAVSINGTTLKDIVIKDNIEASKILDQQLYKSNFESSNTKLKNKVKNILRTK